MSLPHAILGIVADGPHHGRAVARALAHLLDGIRPVNPGQVYATLERLTRRQLIVVRPVTAGEERTIGAKTYVLAPAGRAELRRWLGRAAVEPEPRCGFLERLAVLHALGDARGLAHLLASRRARLEELRDGLATPLRDAPARDAGDARRPRPAVIAALLREAALQLLAAELAWVDDAERALLQALPAAPAT